MRKKGIISIIDFGKKYYLVTFTNDEDQYVVLMEDP